MNQSPSLSESAAPFAHLAEPSDMAFEIAGTIELALLQPRLRAYSVSELARMIDPDIRAFNKRYVAMENALSACCQTALMNGASEDEMRHIADLVEEGDKP